MMVDAVRRFAAELVRPAASAADTACAAPAPVLKAGAAFGLAQLAVPEDLGGSASERSAMTAVLVAEALAHGDMGLAVACLAPAAVSTAISLWGDGDAQATYLPAFVGNEVPPAALAIGEPRALFDPLVLSTRAERTPSGDFVLDGAKSMVPLAARAELLVVAAELVGVGPRLFVVEAAASGVSVDAESAMGLRAAGLGRLTLSRVPVPATALLGGGQDYADCVRLSRLGWCALAFGTAQAVLDDVIPYVNGRTAFGEPLSHRQSIAFMVADIAIELDGMRLATYRAASRAGSGQLFARETALARRLCSDHGMTIGSNGVGLLGGHGYVKEHPVERGYRDLRSIALMEGWILI